MCCSPLSRESCLGFRQRTMALRTLELTSASDEEAFDLPDKLHEKFEELEDCSKAYLAAPSGGLAAPPRALIPRSPKAGTDDPSSCLLVRSPTVVGAIGIPKNLIKTRGSLAQGFVAATLACSLGQSCLTVFAPAMQMLSPILEVSPMQVSFLIASPVLSGSLLRIPFGAYSDTVGSFRPLMMQLIMCTMGVLGIAVTMKEIEENSAGGSYSYWALLWFGCLAGVGLSTFPVGAGQISYWCKSEHQGTLLGLFGGISVLTPGLSSWLLPLGFQQMGYVKPYFCWVGVLMLGSWVYYVAGVNSWYYQLRDMSFSDQDSLTFAKERGQALFPAGNTMKGFALASANWKTWALVSFYFCAFGSEVAVIGWLPLYIKHVHTGVSNTTAGALTYCFTVGTAASRAIAGPFCHRFGGEKCAFYFFMLNVVATLLVCTSGWLPSVSFGLMLLSIGLGGAANATFMLIPQEVPEAIGGASGLVSGLGCFGGFIQSMMMGILPALLGTIGYSASYLIVFLFSAVNAYIAKIMSTVAEEKAAAKGKVKAEEGELNADDSEDSSSGDSPSSELAVDEDWALVK